MKKNPEKVSKVMREFKSGDLKSSSGKKVTNPKQAIAIALSEAGKSKPMKEGGHMKESKAMMKKEVSFMKKKGAPKSMIKHEMAEAGMKHDGKVKKMAFGGMMGRVSKTAPKQTPAYAKPYTNASKAPAYAKPYISASKAASKVPAYAQQSSAKPASPKVGMMRAGGLAAGHKSADGVAHKGKTDTKQVTMKKGGAVKKMRYGGKC
jgi:hypothetical protein